MANEPMMVMGEKSMFQNWVDALIKPREATYAAIATSTKARATTAYL